MGLSILMLSPQFRPLVGGYERAAERLSVALAGRGHAVTVIAERRDPSWPASEVMEGVQVRRLWCVFRKRWHTMTSLVAFTLYLLVHGRRYHVWHVHQYGEQAVLAATMGRILRRPVLLKLTSTGPQGIRATMSATWMSRLKKFALCKVRAVIATTQEVKVEAIAFGFPEGAVHIVGNGVDMSRFQPCSEEDRRRMCATLGIAANGMVLFVGRLSEEKNPHGLLDAWRMANPKMPRGWKLVLVGDGPMRGQLASCVNSEAFSESTIIAGYQSNVEEWISAADIFVMSSTHEGLSNSMLEAMAAGLPVVSTQVSGSIEILRESGAGIVVDVGRMDHLADAVVRLASSAALRIQMGQAARAVVERRYSIAQVAVQHECLYKSLLPDHAHALGRQ
jgi:glycosyltransferase involved in cell wall biosynthesis